MSEAPNTSGHRGLRPMVKGGLRVVIAGLRAIWGPAYAAGARVAAGGTDRAAALAYYAIQAVFPALFVIVFLSLRLSSQGAIDDAIDWAVRQGVSSELGQTMRTSVSAAARRADGAVGIAAVIAALTAVSSASGWFAAVGRAIEPNPACRRQRNLITGRLRAGFWTLVMVSLLVGALFLLATASSAADEILGWLGLGTAGPLWDVARFPLLLSGIVAAHLLIYRIAPDPIDPPRLRTLLPGAIVAAVASVLATLGFFFYVGNLSSIGATYGAFATPIVVLIWLWLSGVVVLYGAELNDVLLERRRAAAHGAILTGADDPEIAGYAAGQPGVARDESGA